MPGFPPWAAQSAGTVSKGAANVVLSGKQPCRFVLDPPSVYDMQDLLRAGSLVFSASACQRRWQQTAPVYCYKQGALSRSVVFIVCFDVPKQSSQRIQPQT